MRADGSESIRGAEQIRSEADDECGVWSAAASGAVAVLVDGAITAGTKTESGETEARLAQCLWVVGWLCCRRLGPRTLFPRAHRECHAQERQRSTRTQRQPSEHAASRRPADSRASDFSATASEAKMERMSGRAR